MKTVKKIVTGSLVSACTMAASSAMALDYFNAASGGSAVFNPKFSGPTIAIAGGSLACTSTFTLTGVVGSPDSVSSASFSGAGCAAINAVLPWSVGAPSSVTGPNNVSITGVTIYLPTPINKTCTGSVTGTLNGSNATLASGLGPGQLTFVGTLTAPAPGGGTTNCIVRSTGNLTSTPTTFIH